MGNRYPPFPASTLQPLFIRCVGYEVIGMTLNSQPGGTKDGWELLPEIAIGEEDWAQAARS